MMSTPSSKKNLGVNRHVHQRTFTTISVRQIQFETRYHIKIETVRLLDSLCGRSKMMAAYAWWKVNRLNGIEFSCQKRHNYCLIPDRMSRLQLPLIPRMNLTFPSFLRNQRWHRSIPPEKLGNLNDFYPRFASRGRKMCHWSRKKRQKGFLLRQYMYVPILV